MQGRWYFHIYLIIYIHQQNKVLTSSSSQNQIIIIAHFAPSLFEYKTAIYDDTNVVVSFVLANSHLYYYIPVQYMLDVGYVYADLGFYEREDIRELVLKIVFHCRLEEMMIRMV